MVLLCFLFYQHSYIRPGPSLSLLTFTPLSPVLVPVDHPIPDMLSRVRLFVAGGLPTVRSAFIIHHAITPLVS